MVNWDEARIKKVKVGTVGKPITLYVARRPPLRKGVKGAFIAEAPKKETLVKYLRKKGLTIKR